MAPMIVAVGQKAGQLRPHMLAQRAIGHRLCSVWGLPATQHVAFVCLLSNHKPDRSYDNSCASVSMPPARIQLTHHQHDRRRTTDVGEKLSSGPRRSQHLQHLLCYPRERHHRRQEISCAGMDRDGCIVLLHRLKTGIRKCFQGSSFVALRGYGVPLAAAGGALSSSPREGCQMRHS